MTAVDPENSIPWKCWCSLKPPHATWLIMIRCSQSERPSSKEKSPPAQKLLRQLPMLRERRGRESNGRDGPGRTCRHRFLFSTLNAQCSALNIQHHPVMLSEAKYL